MRLSRRAPRTPRLPLLSRLMGQETEYATTVVGPAGGVTDRLPASKEVYSGICEAIRRRQPTAAGVNDADQLFLASGAAVSFESHPSLHAAPGGLIEVATAEVRSPAELLASQRSVDAMVAEVTEDTGLGVDLRALKNSADAFGHVYGCQENYETEVARGGWLVVYRGLIVLAWVLQSIGHLVALPAIAVMIAYLLVRRWFFRTAPGPGDEPAAQFESLPRWLTGSVVGFLRWAQLPAVATLRFVGRHVAFRRARRYLLGHLISRVALCGSGELDHEGRYRISAKAMVIDRIVDMGGFRGERPVFVIGHWFEQLCSKSLFSVRSLRPLLRRRQRLQIGLSDSNLADLAEYVKFGSVALLLDMIESGATDGLVSIKKPLVSLGRITRDWNLVTRVPTDRGSMSAIQIQNAYWKAAATFVQSTPANMRGEAPLVLERWREALEIVSGYRRDAACVRPALGKNDWLSKRWMMDRLEGDASWAARKKVDLRYHELSADGYFSRLAAAEPEVSLADPAHVARLRRSPPATSPASRRAWLIREFGGDGDELRSEWRYATIGRGKTQRRIEFIDPAEPRPPGR